MRQCGGSSDSNCGVHTGTLDGERFWHYVLKLQFKVENEAQKPTLSIPGYETRPLEHC